MTIEKLPLYVARHADGRALLVCAHCAVDAQLEGAAVTALYTERRDEPPPSGSRAILWRSDLEPEHVVLATRHPCQHAATYGPD
ncbi:MAG: hypothetical protein U0531_09375 [Dehalococcoidia bacterium]